MRRLIAITLAALLLLGVVSCSPGAVIPRLFDSLVVYGAEGDNTVSVEGNIMAVFYLIQDFNPQLKTGQVMGWFTNAQIVDNDDGTWDVEGDQGSMTGVNQEYITYGLYQYQEIELTYEDDEIGYPVALPIYLDDLDLQPITGDDLPHSMHIAALSDVYLVNGSPRCDVIRLYLGKPYPITGCRVAQQAYDAYDMGAGPLKIYDPAYGLGDDHNKDCFVLVYFVTETPFGSGDSIELPVVVDKVIK